MTASRILDAEQCDAATELLTIGVEQAAAMLGELIGKPIELSIPAVRVCDDRGRTAGIFPEQQSPETIITQAFEGELRGRTLLCFSASSGITLAKLLSGRSIADQAELDSELSGILLEVGNIVLNGVMGSLSHAMSTEFWYSLPELQTANRRGEQLPIDVVGNDDVLICDVRFRVAQQEIDGTIVVVCAVDGIRRMLHPVLQLTPAM